jgi:hypothetical protein
LQLFPGAVVVAVVVAARALYEFLSPVVVAYWEKKHGNKDPSNITGRRSMALGDKGTQIMEGVRQRLRDRFLPKDLPPKDILYP